MHEPTLDTRWKIIGYGNKVFRCIGNSMTGQRPTFKAEDDGLIVGIDHGALLSRVREADPE